MENAEKLISAANALPESVKVKALELIERMTSVIEGIGDEQRHWRPDSIKLVQGTSDRSKLPKGAAVGSFVHGEEILDQPLEVIPLRTWITRQLWSPNQDEAKLLCSSPDGKKGFAHGECKTCPYSQFDEENNRSQCNKTVTAVVVQADLSKVFNLNFSKSNYTNGLDLQKLMTKAGVATYKRSYMLEAKTSPKAKNVEIISVSAGKVVDKDQWTFLEELFQGITDDRKKFLEAFEAYVSKRDSNPALAAPDEGGTVLLDAPKAEEAEAQPAASTGGKTYKF